MNKFIRYASLLLLLSTLSCTSCGRGDKNEAVTMLARVVAVGERIEVEVLQSEYTSGPHWVLTHGDTVYKGADGSKLTRSDIRVGDTVEIYYNGQVMLSYPPQIVAHRIVRR